MKNIEYINYPNPNFIRKNMESLDGIWEFSLDGLSWRNINVPFAPQSELSGIQYTDFIHNCFYKKRFNLQNKDTGVVINFGAVDYETKVFVNGKFVGSHTGGYTPFSFDITEYVSEGDNLLELHVMDELKNVPTGKQSFKKQSFGCFYTRVTGIWQSVWMEFVPKNRIKSVKFYPNIDACSVLVKANLLGEGEFKIKILYDGKIVGEGIKQANNEIELNILLKEKHLWKVGKGNLYDVELEFCSDIVYSYFGLRNVKYQGFDFLINGEKYYQKLVLCQGYYKDGVYTPSNIDLVKQDILNSLELGFNGIRPHQKVFDPRFLYICDQMGVMLWGEFPSWGINYTNTESLEVFLKEWNAVIDRDFNHPSIILWCPLNEVWYDLFDNRARDVKYIDAVYEFTKKIDETRPCVDVSGGHHGKQTDLYDFHCYEDVDKLEYYLMKLQEEGILDVPLLYCKEDGFRYTDGLPVNLSEFGGFSLGLLKDEAVETINEGAVQSESNWGYGEGTTDGEAFVEKYEKLMNVIRKCKKLSGFCYTQLYDIEQEQNGFFTYERVNKLTKEQTEKIKRANDSI